MRKMMSLMTAMVLATSCCAAGAEQMVGMPSPITACESLEAVNEKAGTELCRPAVMGVTDESYSLIDCGSFVIGEYDYEVNGRAWRLRGALTLSTDISGVYIDAEPAFPQPGADLTVTQGEGLYLAQWANMNGQYVLTTSSEGMDEATFRAAAEEVAQQTAPEETCEADVSDYVIYDGQAFERSSLSEETAAWAESYERMSDEEKQAVTSVPEELLGSPFAQPVFTLKELEGKLFTFTSGAGAWSTTLAFDADGSFGGMFSDGELGDTGEGYEDGSIYGCSFSGTVALVGMTDEHTAQLKVTSLTLDEGQVPEAIEDGVRYVTTDPYGIAEGDDLEFFREGRTTSDLDEELVYWLHLNMEGTMAETLPYDAIRDVTQETGFVAE